MPGIIVFNRRWSVGSDDLVVPAVFLLLLHTIWMIVLSSVLAIFDFGDITQCILDLHEHVLGYIVILSGCIIVETCIGWVSMKGTILNTEPRTSMEYLLYVRLGFMFVELSWLIIGVVWMVQHYTSCPIGVAKEAVLGIIVCNWLVLLSVLITIWCTFDAAGRSWVKMKRYQRSLRDGQSKYNYKRSGSTHRDWRHRKVMRAYQESWNTRCRMLFCCMGKSDQSRNSFAEIAKLLSDFFRDLDVVPSDVIAGLVLLRKFQKLERQSIVAQRRNKTYEFLSGIPITPDSKFLSLNDAAVLEKFKAVIHYMQYAISAYGWPMYVKVNSGTGICRLCPHLRCCCCFCCGRHKGDQVDIVEDNCCDCNYAALQKLCKLNNVEMVYVTFHVEVGETPFFVAVDHEKKKVVVSIRGTLSMQDVITDLNAEGEQLPTDVLHDDWLGHKGMVQAAEYIRRKLEDEKILTQAFQFNSERNTAEYGLVLVGHSLGAGAASILAILLRDQFPDLHCYSYSPPGGLLSLPAVEYTKSFITSVVVGKDVVPRIGLHQMEALRSDLINAIKRSTEPKWKVISQSMMCCGSENLEDWQDANKAKKESSRNLTCHPSDSSIALTAHQPLYPPGKIIHIVRHHPKKDEQLVSKNDPVYQAVWADNSDFDEVLISPVMIQDHMPDTVMEALEKVLSNVGPAKPQRAHTETTEKFQVVPNSNDSSPLDRTPPHKLCLETSFTDLNPESNRSSTYSESGVDVLNASWEYPSALEDHLARVFHDQKSNSYPSTIGMPERKVDLIKDDWVGLAPLASPETLSDASSVGSRGSRSNSSNVNGVGVRQPAPVPCRMETIVQSPATSKNSNSGYCIYVDVPLAGSTPVHSSVPSVEPDNDSRTGCLTEAVVEIDSSIRNEANILDLDSDPDDPAKYDLARLCFYVSGDDQSSTGKVSPKMEESSTELVPSFKGTGSSLSVGRSSPRPNSPREKRVTFQIDQIPISREKEPDFNTPDQNHGSNNIVEKVNPALKANEGAGNKHQTRIILDDRSKISVNPENFNRIQETTDIPDVHCPVGSNKCETTSVNVEEYTPYDYSSQYPTPSPSGQTPTLEISVYQENLANAMRGLEPRKGRDNGRFDAVPSPEEKQDPSPSAIYMGPHSPTRNGSEAKLSSPDNNAVKMFFQVGKFTEESSV